MKKFSIETFGDSYEVVNDFKRVTLLEENEETIFFPVISDRCVRCSACFKSCPVAAISIDGEKYKIDSDKCVECLCCQEVCITGAVDMNKKKRSDKYGDGSNIIRIDTRCNFDCMFCTAFCDKNSTISFEQIIKAVDTLYNKGCNTVTITGGEPTLQLDIMNILKYIKEKDMYIDLQTNGFSSQNIDFAKELINCGVNSFFISLHSHKPDIFEKITQRNAFNDVVKGIHNLMILGADIQISHVVNLLNYKDLKEFMSFILEEFNIKKVYVSFVYPNVHKNNSVEIVPRLSEIAEYLNESLKFCVEHNMTIDVEGIPLCYMRNYVNLNIESKRLHWKPKYHIEADLIIEDVHYYNIKNCKKEGNVCSDCVTYNICPKLWDSYVDIYGTDELRLF